MIRAAQQAGAFLEAGLEVIALLDYGNPWASSLTEDDPTYPPDDPEDFEASLEGDGEYVELRIIVRSENLRKARATVDDILACLSAAESGLGAIE